MSERILDQYPPEHVADAVQEVLVSAVAAALENWNEGHWEDFTPDTHVREILENFVGFITAWLETVSDEDDAGLAQSLSDIQNS